MSDHERRDSKSGWHKPRRAGSAAAPETANAWSAPVPLAEIPANGRRIELKADTAIREAVTAVVGVVALPRLEAVFDLMPLANDAVRIAGTVSAHVEQNCVVTLEPISSEVEQKIDLVFVQPGASAQTQALAALSAADDDPPEVLQSGVIDLGVLATEFLMLGIDPYPRKPGAQFEAPGADADPAAHPFAALAALKKDSGAKQR